MVIARREERGSPVKVTKNPRTRFQPLCVLLRPSLISNSRGDYDRIYRYPIERESQSFHRLSRNVTVTIPNKLHFHFIYNVIAVSFMPVKFFFNRVIYL